MPSALPLATYRLQLTSKFTFDDAAAVVPYLADLGVSHVYASPFMWARAGSAHGYDVINHAALNPDLGGEDGFARLRPRPWRAPTSASFSILWPITWRSMGPTMPGGSMFWNGDQPLLMRGSSTSIGRAFPTGHSPVCCCPCSAGPMVKRSRRVRSIFASIRTMAVSQPGTSIIACRSRCDATPGSSGGLPGACSRVTQHWPTPCARWRVNMLTHPRPRARSKTRWRNSPAPQTSSNQDCKLIAPTRSNQPPPQYCTGCWSARTIGLRTGGWRRAAIPNYRRFFDINNLAALRVEYLPAFEAIHPLVLRLINEGRLQGLRLDHIDGLWDPHQYCGRLQNATSPRSAWPKRAVLHGCRKDPRARRSTRCRPFPALPERPVTSG